jgi:DNA-binding NtrC family response regulator
MQFLIGNTWGGNVRELQNVIERGVVLCSGSELRPEDLNSEMKNLQVSSVGTLDDFEKEMVQLTLNQLGGNRKQTSERLGVSLRWLQYKLKEWNIG